MERLELIKRIEKRIFEHQKENGFETIFDFIGEDLSDLKTKFNNVDLADVRQQSELLIAFADYFNYNGKWETNKHNVEAFLKEYESNLS